MPLNIYLYILYKILIFTEKYKQEQVDGDLNAYADERRPSFGGYPYLSIIASHDYKVMTPLTSLEKYPMDSY